MIQYSAVKIWTRRYSFMDMTNITIGTAAVVVVLGMAVVFFGLILLMWVIQISGKIFQAKQKKAASPCCWWRITR